MAYDYNIDENEGTYDILDDDGDCIATVDDEGDAQDLVVHLNGPYRGGYKYHENADHEYDVLDYDGQVIVRIASKAVIDGLMTHLNR